MKFLLFLFASTLPLMLFAQNIDEPFASVEPMAQQPMPGNSNIEMNNFQRYQQNFDPSKAQAIWVKAFDLHALLENQENIQVIDCRPKEAYASSHIPGAQWVGFEGFSFKRVWMLDRETTILVYCHSSNKSLVVSEYLKQVGFKDVRVLDGGIHQWHADNYVLQDQNKQSVHKVWNPRNRIFN